MEGGFEQLALNEGSDCIVCTTVRHTPSLGHRPGPREGQPLYKYGPTRYGSVSCLAKRKQPLGPLLTHWHTGSRIPVSEKNPSRQFANRDNYTQLFTNGPTDYLICICVFCKYTRMKAFCKDLRHQRLV